MAIALPSCQSRWELPSPRGTALLHALGNVCLVPDIFSQVCKTSAKGVPFSMPGLFPIVSSTKRDLNPLLT